MKLISLKNVEEMCANGQTEIILSSNQKITPSAKDFLKNKGVHITYEQSTRKQSSTNNLQQQELVKRITSMLINQYSITDKNELSHLVLSIINKI